MSETKQTEGLADKLTRVYLKIRDKRSELKRAFDAEDKALIESQDKVKGALLDFCKKHELDSVKTSSGLFYRTVKTRYWTSDWEATNAFIKENDLPEFYEKRLNQTAVKEFIQEQEGEVPDFINVKSEYQISVRKK